MSVRSGKADLATERPDFRKGPTAVIGPLELPIVREAVTGAVMPAITLPTNGLRLFRLASTCFNEPLPHAAQRFFNADSLVDLASSSNSAAFSKYPARLRMSLSPAPSNAHDKLGGIKYGGLTMSNERN
jgi:hypothetical protein